MKTNRPSSVDQQMIGDDMAETTTLHGAAGQRWAAGGDRCRGGAGVTHQTRRERSLNYPQAIVVRPGRSLLSWAVLPPPCAGRASRGLRLVRPGERASLARLGSTGTFLLYPYLDARQGDSARAK